MFALCEAREVIKPGGAPPAPGESQAGVGVDLGGNGLATLFHGEMLEGPKPLRRYLSGLRPFWRWLSGKQKGSRTLEKVRMKVARVHYRIRCIRDHALHKLASCLTRNDAGVGIQELNAKGMLQKHHLARPIADSGFHVRRLQVPARSGSDGASRPALIVVPRSFLTKFRLFCQFML
ncbi:MAG: transposase [Acidobacteriota bacterium]